MWISIGSGLLLGFAYGASAFLSLRSAQRKKGSAFLKTAFGGMILRLFAATAILLGVLLLSPVEPLPFVGAFLSLYVLTLVIETVFLHRSSPATDQA